MASIGGNTFGGTKFGIETTGNTGIPDFPKHAIYSKKDVPYATGAGLTIVQYSGKRQIEQLQLAVIVGADDWASFAGKVNTSASLAWATPFSRSARMARLVSIEDARQFLDGGYWRARATFEG